MKRPGPSPRPSLELDSPLWRFALSFYDRDGVAPACLALQNDLGVDVSVLIFAIFAAACRGVELTAAELCEADRLVAGWRGEVVQELRRLRTRLKSGPAPAPSPATEALRDRIKAIELEAEQIGLAMLAAWLGARACAAIDPARAETIPTLVARHYGAGAAQSQLAAAAAPLRTLSRAARQVAESAAESATGPRIP
jgi:uncharacterized protein (TIGR02444 family)